LRYVFAVLLIFILLLVTGCNTTSPEAPSKVAPPNASLATGTTSVAAAVSEATPGLFRDVATVAGIDFVQSNGAEGDFLMVETTPGGCAFFDYNNDGFLDVFLVQSGPTPGSKSGQSRPPCALYRNEGNGKFTDVTQEMGLAFDQGYAQAVAVGDYDNDGYSDLLITSINGCFLMHNEKGTRFTDVSAKAGVGEKGKGRWATSAAFGDYDRDGFLDLVVLHYVPWSRETDRVCKDTKGRKAYCSPEVYSHESPSLYRNRGNGTFEDVTQKAGLDKLKGRGLAVLWTDFDQNGKEDIYIANDLMPNQLLRNLGNGKFREEGLELGMAYGPDGETLSGMGIAPGDFDNTGWESFVITNFSGQPNTVYHNLGKGMIEDATYRSGVGQVSLPFLAFGIEFFDFDRDSWRDLIVGNGHIEPNVADSTINVSYEQPKLLFRNTADGRFERLEEGIGDLAKPKVTRGLAVGDFDNDGRVDILANNHNARAELLKNESPDTNHWISLRLEGTKSNRDGAGALVWITAGGKRYFAQCRLGSSYASVSDTRLFFGLGNTATVEAIEIRWTSGKTERYTGLSLAADGFYWLKEGQKPLRDPRIKQVKQAGITTP